MEKEISFEKELKDLEDITDKIESSSLNLDESLKLYELGHKKIKLLEDYLKKAEGKVAKLVEIKEK